MKCPRCSFENPEGMHFCGKCGCALSTLPEQSTVAPSLEEKLERIQRYLPSGLTKKILAQKDRIEGERRQVTIMFCDMKGFTPLTERLGPEETFILMDKVFEILIHQVNEYEGTVNEIRGDGILAVFGALDALEDAPQRAILSAVEIQKRVAEFSEGLAHDPRIGPIRLRIGINTGPVVIGTVGNDLRVQFTVVGDTINMASRMETLAEPGTTYVTEDTYRLTKDLFHFQPLGKKTIKGKQDPVPVYQVLRPRSKLYRPRLGSERMIYASLVDRDAQLNLLEDQVTKLIKGQGSVVNIIGEAGVGKSRLLAELKNREVMKKVTLLEGWAMSIGRNLSFHPITDILKQWAGIKADDAETTAFNKLQTALRRVLLEDHTEVLPFVATLMGVKVPQSLAERLEGIEGEALEKLILRSMRNLLIKASETSPLIIVMEDLHWADRSSIELLESLLRLAETQSIMFVNLFRPGYKETGERILQGIKDRHQVYSIQIQVDPLNEKDTTSLINNIARLGDVHGPLITQIVERTGGNPFFVEEVMRSFVDEHALVKQNGAFHATEKVNSLPIPSTVRDVLTARMDRLDEQSRDLLKVASVIGRTFLHRILMRVASPAADMDATLSHLQELQLLRHRFRGGESEYLFNHALVQEAAYDSLLPPKRRELHLKVAHSIEQIFNERLSEFYGMLAYHYSQAEDREKTEEFLIKAGEEALRSAAPDEALHYYEEALRLYLEKSGKDADPDKVAMLEKNIALALYNRGRHPEAIKYFDKVLDYYLGESPKGRIMQVIKLMSALLHFIIALYLPFLKFRETPSERDVEIVDLFFKKVNSISLIDAKRFFIEYFNLFRFISSFDLRQFRDGYGIFLMSSALFAYSGISFALSRKALDAVKNTIQETDIVNHTMCEIIETVHHFLGGNWKSLKDHDGDLVDKNCRIGEIYNASQYLFWRGLGLIYRGDFEKAGSIVDTQDGLFEIYGNDLSKAFKYEMNTILLIESGRLHEAVNENERGIAFEEKVHTGLWQTYAQQATIHFMTGAIQKAQECLDRADRIRLQRETAPFQLSCLYKARCDLDLYHLKQATERGTRAEMKNLRRKALKSIRLLRKVQRKVATNRTDSYRLTGAYHWMIDEHDKALRWWRKAVQEGERLGARPQLARVYLEIGRCLLEEKGKQLKFDGVRGEQYMEKAKALFKEIGMESCLTDLDRLAGTRCIDAK
jgi:class 3 adenylate cyclase/tetratricopeptide (TPR) repeat protein